MDTKLFVATKAFILNKKNEVLIIRESPQYQDGSNASLYDLPGGRMKPGQNFKESLLREVDEETGIEIEIGRPFFVNEWRPIVRNEQWQIVGITFECRALTTNVTLSEDHDHYLWINPHDYKKYKLIDGLIVTFESFLQLSL